MTNWGFSGTTQGGLWLIRTRINRNPLALGYCVSSVFWAGAKKQSPDGETVQKATDIMRLGLPSSNLCTDEKTHSKQSFLKLSATNTGHWDLSVRKISPAKLLWIQVKQHQKEGLSRLWTRIHAARILNSVQTWKQEDCDSRSIFNSNVTFAPALLKNKCFEWKLARGALSMSDIPNFILGCLLMQSFGLCRCLFVLENRSRKCFLICGSLWILSSRNTQVWPHTNKRLFLKLWFSPVLVVCCILHCLHE